jgi:hypothetical protein
MMTSHARRHSGTEAAGAAATSHLGDPAAVHGGVGLVVGGGQPGPRRQLLRAAEAGDVPDLGDEHRREDRADPRQQLDGAVSGVGAQPSGDQPGEGVDLEVQRGDQPQQRVDPGPGFHRQSRGGEQLLPGRAEQVAHRHLYAGGGEHGVDLALQIRAEADQLGAVTDPAAQLPGGRWGDPRLGQPTHPQQIRQVRGVALVVLDPAQREHLHSQRMRQMHARAQLGEGVRSPVPAIRRLEHDVGCLAGAAHDLLQVLRIVGDPHRLQLLTGVGHPHQHRPAPVQIHPHDLVSRVLFAHWGLLKSMA